MAVPAELVVGGDDVGLVAPDEPGQTPGGLVQVGLPERARVAVAVRAHHPGVAVAEVLPFGDAQVAHRPLELARPDLAQTPVVVGRVHVRNDDLAELAARPVTSTTRWPASTALAIAPPVPIVSSSGWAWTVMRVGRWPVLSVVMLGMLAHPVLSVRFAVVGDGGDHPGMKDRFPRRLRVAFSRPLRGLRGPGRDGCRG